jgi:hypothetical protein
MDRRKSTDLRHHGGMWRRRQDVCDLHNSPNGAFATVIRGIIATLARLYKAMKSIKNKSQRNQGLPDGNLLTNGVSPAALSPYRQVSTGTVLPRYDAPIILHAEVVSPPATATLMS